MASLFLSPSSQACIIHETRNGPLRTKASSVEGLTSNLSMVCLGRKSFRKVTKKQFRTQAAVVNGEGDLLSYSNNKKMVIQA